MQIYSLLQQRTGSAAHPMWVYMLDSASWVQPRAKPKSHSLSVGGVESLSRVLSSFRSLHRRSAQAQPSLSARSTAQCWCTREKEQSPVRHFVGVAVLHSVDELLHTRSNLC